MKVEIDVSDIPYGSFYSDERCKRVEEIIHKKERYSEFRVKRYRQVEVHTQDSYWILDAKKQYSMRIQPWEIDALNDSELASYIIVSYETSQLDNPAENFYLMGACATALFITLAGAFPIIFQDIQTIIPSYTIITIASLFIGLFLFGVGYHKSKVQTQQMRQTFGEIMSRHPLFLQAIRKFSGLPDIGNSEREEYLERIKEIEEKMADQPPS